MKDSKRFSLNKKDLAEWGKNALIFLAPALLVLIGDTIKVIPEDYKYGAIVLYILNRATALLKLFVQGK